jgi:hypothetical protein
MSATYFEDEGMTVCISDEAYRMYEADAAAEIAAQDQAAKRHQITCGALAAATLIFAAIELLKQWSPT